MTDTSKLHVVGAPVPSDATDISCLWLDPSLGNGLTETAYLSVPVGKPKDFFRVCPHETHIRRTEVYTHKVEGVIGPDSELVDLVSVTFDEARELDLPTITKVIIAEVEERLNAGFAPYLPVPFYWEKRGSFVREEL